MGIFLLHFIPFVIFSILIVRSIRKKNLKTGGGLKLVFVFLILLLVYRPFIIAMWMVSNAGFLIFMGVAALLSLRRKKSWSLNLERYIIAFTFAFPLYLIFAIFVFLASVGDRCGEVREKGVIPIFSLCDRSNYLLARRYSSDVYHCRNAFLSADRKLVYIGFGAETINADQVLIGVDRETREIKRIIPTKTVFGGYCHPELGDCVMLITPKERIRLWNDEKQQIIKEFYSPKDRPRFFSVDTGGRQVYVASDAAWIAVVDLAARKIVKKIQMPTGSLLTVSNTRKRVVATKTMLYNPMLMVYDKKTGKIENIYVGLRYLWKNFGFFFHVKADPDGERAFMAAPFECAVYAVDLERKKVLWRQKLPIGIRDMAYDTKRKVLYAGNFVNGYVYKIDASGDRPRVTGRFFIGKRLRYFNYEPDEDIFLSASANGFYIYDPDPDRKLESPRRAAAEKEAGPP